MSDDGTPAAASAARCAFAARTFGRASICHCRMCQKAFGGFFGALVTVHDLEWTRGAPTHFPELQQGASAASAATAARR